MAGIANDVKQIRQALYGREVREAIAHGIEQCYSDVTAGKTVADTAAAAANTATQNAQTATQQANQARDNAQAVADGVVNQSITAINDAAAQQRQSVNDLGDQLKSYMSEHYSETITKAEAKVNRSSVSTVKHAIGTRGQLTLTDALDEPAKKMTIHLEPKQDLHGYDHPWIGGAGKNLLPQAKATNVSGDNGDLSLSFADDGSITLNGTSGSAPFYIVVAFEDPLPAGEYTVACFNRVGVPGLQFSTRGQNRELVGMWTAMRDANKIYTENVTAASYYWQLQIQPSTTCNNVKISPMLVSGNVAPTSFEPYSNICPIEGFDNANIYRVGKNLIFKFIDSVLVDNTGLVAPNSGYNVGIAKVMSGEKYTILTDDTTNVVAFYADQPKIYDRSYDSSRIVGNMNVFVAPIDGFMVVRCKEGTHNITVVEGSMSLNEHLPVEFVTHSINLVSSAGSTVYGGTVTVNEDGSGTLALNTVYVEYDGSSDEGWSLIFNEDMAHSYFVLSIGAKDTVIDHSGISNLYSDVTIIGSNTITGMQVLNSTGFNSAMLYVRLNNMSEYPDRNTATFRNMLADNPLKVAYRLSSASNSFPITANQIKTIAGTNHIWTDGTNIELDYYGDKYCTYEQVMEMIANALKS